MAARKPLVLVSGEPAQLPESDRLALGQAVVDTSELTEARTLTLADVSGQILVATVSSTEPASPTVGQLWLQTS